LDLHCWPGREGKWAGAGSARNEAEPGPGGWPRRGGGRAGQRAAQVERDRPERRDQLRDDRRRPAGRRLRGPGAALGDADPSGRPDGREEDGLDAGRGRADEQGRAGEPNGERERDLRVRRARTGRRLPPAPAEVPQRDRRARSRQGCGRAARGSPAVAEAAIGWRALHRLTQAGGRVSRGGAMVEQAARILGSTRTDLELAIIEGRERHVSLGADRLTPGRHPPDGQRALGTHGRGLVGSAASALAAGRERHGDLRAVRVMLWAAHGAPVAGG
jgi:hypothetical protein